MEDKSLITYLIEKIIELKLEAEACTYIDDNWKELLLEEKNEYYKWDYISTAAKIISEYYY